VIEKGNVNHDAVIDLKTFHEGAYILKISCGDISSIKKLIISQ
jgi:hypothetical protein